MADTEKILKMDNANADALARQKRLQTRMAQEGAAGAAPQGHL